MATLEIIAGSYNRLLSQSPMWKHLRIAVGAAWAILTAPGARTQDLIPLAPAKMARAGEVDARFQSYNVEMVEVTGGRFWAPYRASGQPAAPAPTTSAPTGVDPAAFRYRPPVDLANPRLRKLAAALGPAYMRVSGTWANSTYFHDADTPPPAAPPAGFGGVLTREQWKGVVEFARAVNARIVTSFAVSPGVRDAAGVWTPDQARKLVAYTKELGGSIAAAEMFNEPNLAAMGGAPKGYDAAAYGRDFAAFHAFAKASAPGMLILGPGSLGEDGMLQSNFSGMKSEDMLKAAGHGIDRFSYHFYGAVSKRCGGMPGTPQTSPAAALSEEWLARTEHAAAFYGALRDRIEPGKPLWLTETAETACGGNPWAATFLDSFRYLEQLARLARRGVQVVIHNTLAASDYALIDEETLAPRPNYWAALLWRKLMGRTVLDAGISPVAAVHLYAHCLPGRPGGVAVLAVNTDRGMAHALAAPPASRSYTLTAKDESGSAVLLNGSELKLGAGDALPSLEGRPVSGRTLALPPASITFLAIPGAGNASCRAEPDR